MTASQLFTITNTVAMAAWLLLAILPGRRWVTETVTGTIVPVFFATIYLAIVLAVFAGAEGSFSTLEGVATLFTNRWLLLAGWVHYLAFDLFIGTWEVRDARARGVRHLFVLPCLLLTFLFGPVGWLLYRGIRAKTGSSPALIN